MKEVLRMSGSIRPLPIYAFTAYTETALSFTAIFFLYHFMNTCAISGPIVITERLLADIQILCSDGCAVGGNTWPERHEPINVSIDTRTAVSYKFVHTQGS